MELNYAAVAVAAVAAFVAAFGYYVALGKQLAAAGSAAAENERPSPWLVPVELVKHLVIAAVIAGLVVTADITGVPGGLLLGAALWVAFPVTLLVGSVFHEKTPLRLAVLHAGDWLLKLLLIAAIVSAWR